MTPRLSVIVVSFRSRRPLAGCLRSLVAAAVTPPEAEVVVIDNASGDGTVEWLAETYPWVRVVANTENAGFTRGVNQGIALARGERLLILNPDCELQDPSAIERLAAALEKAPGLAAAAPALVTAGGGIARSCGRFPDLWTLFCDHLGLAQRYPESPVFGAYKYGGQSLAQQHDVDWASGAALLMPAPVWREIGGFDENIFMYMEEVDWCRRAAKRGYRIRYVPAARIVHLGQQSAQQVPGASYLHNLRSRVYYFRKHHGPVAALAAKGILCSSLVLKWLVMHLRRGRPAAAIYAAGFAAAWRSPWFGAGREPSR